MKEELEQYYNETKVEPDVMWMLLGMLRTLPRSDGTKKWLEEHSDFPDETLVRIEASGIYVDESEEEIDGQDT